MFVVCRVRTSTEFNKLHKALGLVSDLTPRPPPKKVRAVHPTVSVPPSLSVPTQTLRRSEYRLKAFVWPARKASCLAQAQAPKQVAAAGDPALGGGLLRTLDWKARRPRQPSPHLRRAAVAILISDRLDAASASHSDIAALKAQVYAHHRHGAGYCSGSGPGPAADTAHGPGGVGAWRGRAAWADRAPRLGGRSRTTLHEDAWVLGKKRASTAQAGSGSTAAEEAPVAGAEKISKALVATGARLLRENCAGTKCSRETPAQTPFLLRLLPYDEVLRHVLAQETGEEVGGRKLSAAKFSIEPARSSPHGRIELQCASHPEVRRAGVRQYFGELH